MSISGKIHAVVKADAYGHGAVPVARALQKVGCESFCVADFNEAFSLRHGLGGDYKIIVLGFVPPLFVKKCIFYGITPTVFSFSHASALNDNLGDGEELSVFIALDTGMNRKGVKCDGKFSLSKEELKEILRLPRIKVDGIYTHFHAAVPSEKGQKQTKKQRTRFYEAIKELILDDADISLSTRTLWQEKGFAIESVRAGLALYGYPDGFPVMKLVSTVVEVRSVKRGEYVGYGFHNVKDDSKIALVPVGYADGIVPIYSGRTVKIHHGDEVFCCKIFGRVCMDFTLVEVSNLPVVPGDKVVFFGETPSDLLSVAGNVVPVHSLLTAVSSRVKRIYKV